MYLEFPTMSWQAKPHNYIPASFPSPFPKTTVPNLYLFAPASPTLTTPRTCTGNLGFRFN